MLEFFVTKGQELKRRDHDVVSADTTDLKAQFDLTSDFTGTITVWWRRSDKPGSTWTSTLSGNQCTIPAEALSAATDNVMYGDYDHFVFVSISDTGRTTSAECEIKVNKSAFSTNSTPGTGGSPTAYEELVEQFDELKADNQTFKDNMTEQQESFESTVTENVDNIRYVVETETAPPIIEEASGAEITLNDSAYRQVRGLQLYGYSKQIQTTGAQLIPYPYFRKNGYIDNGITYTVSDDGVITANGTATAESLFFLATEQSDWRPNGNVFMSGCPSGGSASSYGLQIYNYDSEGSFAVDLGQGAGMNFTNTDDPWNLCIRINTSYTANNLVFYPMLSSGSSALPWEPYSGGVASPSPDWAQPIHSVADEVNLLESLTMDINAPSAEFPETSDILYIMLCPESGTSQVNIHLRYNDGTYGQDVAVVGSAGSNGTEYHVFITPSKPCTGVSIYNVTSSSARSLSYGMVAISDTALPWRPYGHNVTVESAGANLINVSKTTNAVNNGISVKALGDGSFSYSGTAGDANINVWIAGTRSSTKELTHLREGKYTALTDDARYFNDETWINSGNKIEAPSNGMPITGVRAPQASIGTYYNKIISPMLNRGSTPLPWQPYVAPSSALITLTDSLRGIPVNSGGNYTDEDGQQWIADYIYRSQTDGKWMLWRNIKCAEYDGSTDEVWNVSVAGDNIFTRSDFSGVPLDGLCNRFRYKNNLESAGEFEFDTNHSFRFYTELNGVSAWKAWLQSNPLEVVYQLATPTIEELPEDVQAELNGLYTYNLHTDMWNSDGAYMNLKYVADTKTWINNKIAGLSTAMLNQN